jgi:putative transposase
MSSTVASWSVLLYPSAGSLCRQHSQIAARIVGTRLPRRIQQAGRQRADLRNKTVDMMALNLKPCFTHVESPESNGIAEAFVKTFERDYVPAWPRLLVVTRRSRSRKLDGRLTHGCSPNW